MADEILEGAIGDYFSSDIGGIFDNKAISKKKGSLALKMDYNTVDECVLHIIEFHDELNSDEKKFLFLKLAESYLKQAYALRHNAGEGSCSCESEKGEDFNRFSSLESKIIKACKYFEKPVEMLDLAIKMSLNDPFNLFELAKKLKEKSMVENLGFRSPSKKQEFADAAVFKQRAKELYDVYFSKTVKNSCTKKEKVKQSPGN